MTSNELTVGRLYLFTALFGVCGFVFYVARLGVRPAFGFLLGAAGSFANLWLFSWLSRSIAPGERQQKPWTASLFFGRYLGLGLAGYATVKALDVNPVPVLLGLLASTAAVLASSLFEMVRSFSRKKSHTSNGNALDHSDL